MKYCLQLYLQCFPQWHLRDIWQQRGEHHVALYSRILLFRGMSLLPIRCHGHSASGSAKLGLRRHLLHTTTHRLRGYTKVQPHCKTSPSPLASLRALACIPNRAQNMTEKLGRYLSPWDHPNRTPYQLLQGQRRNYPGEGLIVCFQNIARRQDQSTPYPYLPNAGPYIPMSFHH